MPNNPKEDLGSMQVWLQVRDFSDHLVSVNSNCLHMCERQGKSGCTHGQQTCTFVCSQLPMSVPFGVSAASHISGLISAAMQTTCLFIPSRMQKFAWIKNDVLACGSRHRRMVERNLKQSIKGSTVYCRSPRGARPMCQCAGPSVAEECFIHSFITYLSSLKYTM